MVPSTGPTTHKGRPRGRPFVVALSARDPQKWCHLLNPVVLASGSPEVESVAPRPRVQTQRRLDQDGQQNVIAAYQQGKTMNEVARQFGLHRTTVRAILDRAGITVRPREMSTTQVNLAIKLYADGLSLQAVGERLGFNAQTIANRLLVAGIQMRSPHAHPQPAGADALRYQ